MQDHEKQLDLTLDGLREVIYTRLEAMDKAQALFEENLTRVPTEVDKQISHLRELTESKLAGIISNSQSLVSQFENRLSEVKQSIESLNGLIEEKFSGVKDQFALRDKGVKETAELTGLALAAALAAAEKASQKQNDSFAASAAKMEAGFIKTQDQQSAAVAALSNALSDKLQDQKERITAIESRSGGMGSMWGYIAGAAGLFFAFLGVAISLAIYLSNHSQVSAVAPIVIPK